MLLNENDLAYLLDIHNICLEIISFTKGLKFHHFENNKMAIRAVERGLEIIGEASNKISDETKQALPKISWDAIRGLRNRLAHDYGNIKTFRIWGNAINDIPILLKDLKNINELKPYLN